VSDLTLVRLINSKWNKGDVRPDSSGRNWVSTRMCRNRNIKDVGFRICLSRTHSVTVIVMAGSVYGLEFVPVIGEYVVDLIK
jgi:hypothetical protein